MAPIPVMPGSVSPGEESFPFQTALVTGAGVRLGREIALALARAGCNVVIHYGRSAAAAADTVHEIGRLGRQGIAIGADLLDPQATTALVDRANQTLGPVDLLVNSAAIFEPGGLLDTDLEHFERHLAVNLRAPFLLSRRFVEQLPSDRNGAIVNVGDARTNRPGSGHFAYRLSKAALEAQTRNLALELAPRIRVLMVAPGAVLPAPGEPQERLDEIARTRVPLRRSGSPEAVARHVVHLLSDPFLTGVVLPIDGGEWL